MKEATREELENLSEWIKDPENETIFNNFIETNVFVDLNVRKYDVKKAKKKILRHISKDKNKFFNRSVNRTLKYAALVLLFIGVGYFYNQEFFKTESTIVIPDDAITLELGNGHIEIITKDGSTEVVDKKGNVVGSQKGNQIVYDNEFTSEELVYNTIKVPYGKRFEIKLSDGTIVFLNAGTSLKYPVKFIEGEQRQVFLNGEAYFDVTKDTKHPFIVNAEEMNVRVLGTKFNVSSYPEDEKINTVLVEGSVSIYERKSVYNADVSTVIKPGFKASWEKSSKQIEVEETDTNIYTAWINGEIRFRHMPFKNILKKLERHYNVIFVNNNKHIENRLFTASFETESIEQVLQSFNRNYTIDYSIKNNLIIINP